MSLATIVFILAMSSLVAAIAVHKTQSTTKTTEYALFAFGWILFGLFWALRFPYYVFKTRSLVYLFILPFASIGCIMLGLSAIKATRNNTTLPHGYYTITISGAIASIVYMPFTLINTLRKFAIETVTVQTHALMHAMGITNVTITTGPEFGYQSGLLFTTDGLTYLTYIAQNCTGIGSIAIITSVLWVTNLSPPKKIVYSLISVSTIYILNLGRNVMIAVGYGHQWFNFLEPVLTPILGYEDPHLVSFFIIDKVIAQLGSVIALLIIFYIFLQKFPELQTQLMEVLRLVDNQLPETISDYIKNIVKSDT